MADKKPLQILNGETEQFQTGDTIGVANGGTGATTAAGAVANFGLSTAASLNVGNITFSFDGQGGVIATSAVAYGVATIAGTITAWYILSDVSGSCVIDLKKWNGASYATVIGTGNSPTLTAAAYATAAQNGSWTSLAVAIGDRFQITITSLTTITKLAGSFTFTKT